ncbi:hypothetical protein CLV59_10484 [Chitinophaga dinghuensis]|uniref:Carboxypeptidase-like protein n=1 Tax=Chitinophaga dinghuensis TaxID=1539050 RepID=A0A327VY10_9BACT|nr:hypothetical protein [Chitinophaga dinghuensis]RAJ81859.1 hypothetical protein CLV59_10484 [Chitinophaga dinghuensis]
MKYLLCFTLCSCVFSSSYGQTTSLYFSGRVIDEKSQPVDSAMILVFPFKYDSLQVSKKDTFYSNNNGEFMVCGRKQQIRYNVYCTKDGYFTELYNANVRTNDYYQPIVKVNMDSAFILRRRSDHYITGRQVNDSLLGLPLREVLPRLGLHLMQFSWKNRSYAVSPGMMNLRAEIADSTQILLVVWPQTDFTPDKEACLPYKVTGIGIAFTDGRKKFYGLAGEHPETVYNEYYEDRKGKSQPGTH